VIVSLDGDNLTRNADTSGSPSAIARRTAFETIPVFSKICETADSSMLATIVKSRINFIERSIRESHQ
jgi:hypothetical protein